MKWFDWLIVLIPLAYVFWMGFYSRRYLKDVSAFLTAGRVCGRYVISVGSIVNALSVIGLLSYAEMHCKTGFALSFWNAVTIPITVLIGLYGYCTYRYRETKAQSIGQFLEIRYSRNFRIFAATIRSISEILANMIMPALAARFFIYFLDLPEKISLFGMSCSVYHCIMVLVLIAAISIICLGGSLAIIVTDTIQGFICYPLMVLFIVFILCKFSWSTEILPVLSSRVQGESFLNPYEIYNLRDFNYFFLIVGIFSIFVHRLSWAGSGGGGSAARTAHEQKMAGLLGSWRAAIGNVFYVLLAISLLAFMNHWHFADKAHKVRTELTSRIAKDVISDPQVQQRVMTDIQKMPVWTFHPESGNLQANKDNVDTKYLSYIRNGLTAEDEAQGNLMFQKFRTLYHQQMLSSALRNLLPPGLLGLFCLLMILAMISTDDTRIFSSAVTISQDVILPFVKKELTPRQHMWMIRWVAIGIGVFFFIGSSYMAQLDYISMYVQLITTMWLGGCGPLLIFGLYSKFGTTKGAWASLLTGIGLAILGVLIQRNWADHVYPWLSSHNLAEATGNMLSTLSRPFEPIIEWRMNPVKCPINSYEWFFMTELITFVLYISVSWLTYKTPYNLERMLHRGKYAEQEVEKKSVWTWKNLYSRFVGITPEYTFWDKVLAWCYFVYQFGYRFFCAFLLVVIWNCFSPWSTIHWGWYFLIVFLIIPGTMALITAVWFGICGTLDLRQMFRDLEKRVANHLDNGRVEGNVSLADKAHIEKIETGSGQPKWKQERSQCQTCEKERVELFPHLRWGFSTLGCPQATLPEAMEIADAHGLEFLELRSLSGSNKIHETLYRPENLASMRRLAASGRCRVIDSSFPLALFSSQEREELLKIARTADDFQIPYIRIFGHTPILQELTDEVLQICLDNLEWFQQQHFQARLALETHDTFLETERVIALQKAYGKPLPIVWDAHNTRLFTGYPLEKTLSLLGENIVTVHFKDSHFQGAERRYAPDLPGKGKMPLLELFSLLAERKVEYPVILEYEKMWKPSLPPVEKALEAWEELVFRPKQHLEQGND